MLILLVGVVVWRILRRMTMNQQRNQIQIKEWVPKAVLTASLVLPVLIITFSTFVIISTGHVGVVTQFSKVEPTPLYEGFNLVAPWKVVNQMSVQIQKKTDKFGTGSKDSQPVYVVMTINYRLKGSSAPEVFRTVGYDYAGTIIVPAEQETLKAHTALYTASNMLAVRPTLKHEVQEDLQRWLIKYGVELTEVSLADIDFDKDYKEAIARKQIEEQKAAQKTYEVIQANKQAEIAQATAFGLANAAREAAKGAADAVRAEAQAAADALRLKGQAQAEYNSKVAASLTSTLIEQQRIAAWQAGGSQVPQFVTGSSGPGFLMNIPAPSAKQTEKHPEK